MSISILKKAACDLKLGDQFCYVGGFGAYRAVSDAFRCEQIPTKVVLMADRKPFRSETEPRRLRVRLNMWETVSVMVFDD